MSGDADGGSSLSTLGAACGWLYGFFGRLPSRSACLLLRKEWDTAFGYRLSSQVSSSKDNNAPCGAITKSVRSGTLLAPKEYPEKCRCSACSGPTRLAGRPGRRGRFSLACSSLRPSERIKQSVRLDGLTNAANRPPPLMGGRKYVHHAAAKAGPWQNLHHLNAPKALQQTPAPAPQGGLGAKPPLWNPVRGPRNVERTYGLFAVSERAANASLFAARRVQGNMRNAGVKKIGASYFE